VQNGSGVQEMSFKTGLRFVSYGKRENLNREKRLGTPPLARKKACSKKMLPRFLVAWYTSTRNDF
jgi:hypothetical protein